MIDWNMFGAGVALVGFVVTLLILAGVLATFKARVNVPWFIPTALFILGLLLIMQSVGMITDLNKLIMLAVSESNIPEFVLGLVLVLFAIYKNIYARFGIEPSGYVRLSVLAFGIILILDSLRILPILYYLSQIIGSATQVLIYYLVLYPWLGVFIVLAFVTALAVIYMKLKKLGGVGA